MSGIYKKITGIVVFYCVGLFVPIIILAQAPTDTYEKGRNLVESGKFTEALDYWLNAVDADTKLTSDSTSEVFDVRIGITFIEIAAAQMLKSYYEEASSFYYQILKPQNISESPLLTTNRDALLREIKYLKPLTENGVVKKWRKGVKAGDGNTLKQIYHFWKKLDYTPTTPYNERLLEHWERIAYSKEKFKQNNVTVYGTDHRALTYIKYGAPSWTREGIMKFNFSTVSGLVREVAMLENQKNGTTTLFGGNGRANQNMEINVNSVHSTAEVQHYFGFPKYEVWVYEQLTDNKLDPVLYIYGNEGGTGQFRQLRSLGDMINKSAFRRSNNMGNTNVPPAAFIQLMMYDQLSIVDDYFDKAYTDLRRRMMSFDSPVYSQISSDFMKRNEQKLTEIQMKAPQDYSNDAETLFEIELSHHPYRVLRDNQPHVMLLTHSDIDYLFELYELLKKNNYSYNPSKLALHFSAEHFSDEKYDIRSKVKYPGSLKSSEYDSFTYTQDPATIVLLTLPHGADSEYKNTANVIDETNSGDFSEATAYKENMLATSRYTYKTDLKPLATDESKLVVSDPVLGYGEAKIDKELPFYVSKEMKIPQGSNLKILFETYHLQSAADGTYSYTLKYSVEQKVSFFKKIFNNSNSNLAVTLNFETDNSKARNLLEIETRPLKKGEYTINMEITDRQSSQSISRAIDFDIH